MGPTLPPIQDHTLAKHDILKRYLAAWFPILGRGSGSKILAYVDGFSGPGQYEGGEPGSPLITLNLLSEHNYLSSFAESGKRLNFLFVELKKDWYEGLKSRICEST